MRMYLAAAAASLILASGGQAAAAGWGLELNGAEAYETTGVELGGGYRFASGNFSVTPVVGALIYQGENSRYRSETFKNGNTVCRDISNGQFADDTNCNNTAAEAYGRLEAGYRFKSVGIGVGGRFSDSGSGAYGTISALVSERLALKVNAGADYVALGMTFGF